MRLLILPIYTTFTSRTGVLLYRDARIADAGAFRIVPIGVAIRLQDTQEQGRDEKDYADGDT